MGLFFYLLLLGIIIFLLKKLKIKDIFSLFSKEIVCPIDVKEKMRTTIKNRLSSMMVSPEDYNCEYLPYDDNDFFYEEYTCPKYTQYVEDRNQYLSANIGNEKYINALKKLNVKYQNFDMECPILTSYSNIVTLVPYFKSIKEQQDIVYKNTFKDILKEEKQDAIQKCQQALNKCQKSKEFKVIDDFSSINTIPEEFCSKEVAFVNHVETLQGARLGYRSFVEISDKKTLCIRNNDAALFFYKKALVVCFCDKFIIMQYKMLKNKKMELSKQGYTHYLLLCDELFQYNVAFDNESTVDYLMAIIHLTTKKEEFSNDDIVQMVQETRIEQEKIHIEEEKEKSAMEEKEHRLLELSTKNDICKNAYNWVITNRKALWDIQMSPLPNVVNTPRKKRESDLDWMTRINTMVSETFISQSKRRQEILDSCQYFRDRTNDLDAKEIYNIFMDENLKQ